MRNIVLVIVIIIVVSSILYLETHKSARPATVSKQSADIPLVLPPAAAEPGGAPTLSSTGTPVSSGTAPLAAPNATSTKTAAGPRAPAAVAAALEQKTKEYPRAKELVSPAGFINTPSTSSGQSTPITIKDLVGKKVILVDFWTYSCINCQRTLPYLNGWYEKYSRQGLEIVGVHTPEFEFEKNYDNVKKAVEKFGVKYPVVLDNDYGTWSAYGNRYWPRKYLIDIDGFIVYDHIGEGAYDETELQIQKLLVERLARLGEQGSVASEVLRPAEAETSAAQSPEVYFGAARNSLLGNGVRGKTGPQTLAAPPEMKLNTLYLVGDWNILREYAENTGAGAKIIFRYRAKSVYIVASAPTAVGVTAKILRDGKPLGAEAGADVTKSAGTSSVNFKDDRLYKLIEDPAGAGEHTIEIIIEGPGLRAYTFTFG